jgi:chaperonin GroES
MLRPLQNRIIVKKLERSEKTAGGIIIPQTASEDHAWQAEVRAVGPGKRLDSGQIVEPSIKTGDTVVIGRFRGSEIKVEGEALFVVEGDDVLGVVE